MGITQTTEFVYNVEVEGSKKPGFSAIYRNSKLPKQLVSTPNEAFRNMRDIFLNTFKEYPNSPGFGKINIKNSKRELQTITFRQYQQKIERLGKNIMANKLEYQAKDGPNPNLKMIGIYSKNRLEWFLVDGMCILFGLTSIPLYDTLGTQNLTYCLNETQVTTLFVTADTIKQLLKLGSIGNLNTIISFDKLDNKTEEQIKNKNCRLLYLQNLLASDSPGANSINYHSIKIDRDDILTFSYTSGTTGPPKGAMLSHGNFLAFLASFENSPKVNFSHQDSYLSFLPLPHVFERVMAMSFVSKGCLITSFSGNILQLKEDMQLVKPTIFVAVPRLYNKIMDGIEAEVAKSMFLKSCMFESDTLGTSGDYQSGFYDSIVFSKVREKFGGRIRQMITGSAPINAKTQNFMKAVMSCPLIEGYGQTENTAAAFIQLEPKDHNVGHCGGIVPSLQFKLMDLPEMQYTSDDKNEQGHPTPRGEIWLRGPSVFKGYYKNKEKTEEALSKDGWLRTGDIGMMLPNSKAMKIIDRKKNIFKLSQGEYVASEKVCHYVNEVFLYGDSLQNFAVAIISGNESEIKKLAEARKINGSFEQLCSNKEIRTLVCKQLNSIGRKEGLNSLQNAKNVFIDFETFQKRDILTNTMKLQRFAAKKYYKTQIDSMYSEGELKIKD